MWPKNKKQHDDLHGRQEDFEQDLQSLREERDELKAWCQELEARQRQQGFSQQVFRYWACAMDELKQVKGSLSLPAKLWDEKNQKFLSHHLEYTDRRKDLLEYVDGFTETYRQVNNSQEHVQQIQSHASKVINSCADLDGLTEHLRLLSLNIAIESSHTDKQQLTDSITGSLREMSDSSRKVCAEITALNQGIESDSKLAENSFTTVTDGFIGFSRAISPLLTAADQSAELILELTFIARQWIGDNFQQSMQVEHLLWKFDIYSVLLGIVEGPIVGRGELANWEGMLPARGAVSVRIEEALAKAGQLGKDIQGHHLALDTDAMLVDLLALDELSELLFQCFDELRQEIRING